MEKSQMKWKEQDPWGWKEFILLMLLEFGLVSYVLNSLLSPYILGGLTLNCMPER